MAGFVHALIGVLRDFHSGKLLVLRNSVIKKEEVEENV